MQHSIGRTFVDKNRYPRAIRKFSTVHTRDTKISKLITSNGYNMEEEIKKKVCFQHRRRFSLEVGDSCGRAIDTEQLQKFPKKIINILYRQHIPNYNPFLIALEQAQNVHGLEKRERIKDLCYIGLGKCYVKNKKYAIKPAYGRVNMLIRTYMTQLVKDQVQTLKQQNTNCIYLNIGQTALSYNHKHYPQKLKGLLQKSSFEKIIMNVNKIIEKQFIAYKKASIKSHTNLTKSDVITAIVVMLLTTFLFVFESIVLCILVFLAIIVGIVFSSISAKFYLDGLTQSKDTSQRVQESIKKYFLEIKNESIEWRVGKDFYWLEIHVFKKKKKILPYITELVETAYKKNLSSKRLVSQRKSAKKLVS